MSDKEEITRNLIGQELKQQGNFNIAENIISNALTENNNVDENDNAEMNEKPDIESYSDQPF